MASDSSSTQPPMSSTTSTVLDFNTQQLISINAAAQLPLKLTATTYPVWRKQFLTCIKGYGLGAYLDTTTPIPPKYTTGTTINPAHTLWERQDQLLQNAIISSSSPEAMAQVSSANTVAEAWQKLEKLYAGKTRPRIVSLKNKLSNASKGSHSMREYLQLMKSISADLALADSPIDEDVLVLHIINGLGSEYKNLQLVLRTRPTPISYEELFDFLVEEDEQTPKDETINIATANLARRNSSDNNQFKKYTTNRFYKNSGGSNSSMPPSAHNKSPIRCQICNRSNHSAKKCWYLKQFADGAQP